MSKDLEVLAPTGASVAYRGERLEITPLTVGQLPRLVRVARPVIDAVLDLESLPGDNDGALLTLVMDMVERHGEAAFEAVAVATGRDLAWIEGGDLAEFIALAKAVIEVNRDFFDRKLAPLLAGRAAGAVDAKSNGAGPTSSSSSSTAATH